MSKENKFFTCEIKATEESTDEKGIFEGHANTFGNIDLQDDIVEAGAFKKTLRESKQRGLFFMHNVRDINNLLGKATNLKEDDTGLFMKGEIDLTFESGRKAFSMIKQGVIDRMSIGFQVIKATFEEIAKQCSFIRHIKELKLFEISLIPLNMAANPQALITNVKSNTDIVEYIRLNKDDKELRDKIFSLYGYLPEPLSLTPIEGREPGKDNTSLQEIEPESWNGNFFQELMEKYETTHPSKEDFYYE